MNPQNIYCRLCAEPKPNNKQVELQSDAEQRNEIIQKLSRINATTEFHYNNLPTTVCRDCISTLNKCFDFVTSVEQAQKVLLEIVAQPIVKIEDDDLPLSRWKDECYFENKDSIISNTSLNTDLKVESDSEESFKIDVDDHLANLEFNNVHLKTESVNEDKQPPKPKKRQIPDSIPLFLDKTWADYNWKCTYCELQFPTIMELQSHGQENHKACNPYRCTNCNFRKARLDKFLLHIEFHHKEFKYSCYRCFTKFESTLEARRHKAFHTKFNTKFCCPGCKSTFDSETQHKLHTETYYQVQKPIDLPQVLFNGLTCVKCSKTFKTKAGLKAHVIHMHTDRKKNFVCETCGKRCFNKSNLTQHAFTHADDRPHKCPICKKGFKTVQVLKDHLGRHNDEKPFSCDECGSSFRLRRDLTKHRAIHSDGTPFKCKYCSKRFALKQYLKYHERLHSGVKPYSCDICDHSYADWANYNKHMKQRHNIDTSKKKVLAASSLVNKS